MDRTLYLLKGFTRTELFEMMFFVFILSVYIVVILSPIWLAVLLTYLGVEWGICTDPDKYICNMFTNLLIICFIGVFATGLYAATNMIKNTYRKMIEINNEYIAVR